jgi:hypothetical protein
LVSHSAEEESIGPGEVLGSVPMQVFVDDPCTMIVAPVQRDVDGIPKGSHVAVTFLYCPMLTAALARRICSSSSAVRGESESRTRTRFSLPLNVNGTW